MKNKLILNRITLIAAAAAAIALILFFLIPQDPPAAGEQTQAPGAVYSVTFLGPDEAVLYVDTVSEGAAARPPVLPLMPQGYIFSHWDTDFSCVTGDLTVRAVCTPAAGTNTLALGGGYVRQGERLVLPLQLCGDVCLCALDIQIRYDNTVLDFEDFRTMDGAVDAGCIEADGVIHLTFASYENTTGEVDLAELAFTAIGEPGETKVEIQVQEIVAFDENYDFLEPGCTVIDAAVTVAG